jgi:rhodanese-related sulfurtransferase
LPETIAMPADNPSPDYAGDLSADEAWALLKGDPKARLIDVRTSAEWNFVGIPDLREVGREAELVEWQSYPTMQVNPAFAAQAEQGGADRNAPVLFLCRSGARSRAAAIAMTRAGYTRAYNIANGFEGDLDAARQRGHKNGWKASGLPWKQT